VSLSPELSRHRVVIHLTVVTMVLALITSLALPEIRAGLTLVSPQAESILPTPVGAGVLTGDPVTLAFDAAMDPASVGSSLTVSPLADVRLAWSEDLRSVEVYPATRWATDQRYQLTILKTATRTDGSPIGRTFRAAFTTQTAPWVTAFVVNLAGPPEAAGPQPLEGELGGSSAASLDQAWTDASAGTAISISFSVAMDRASVESAFQLSPAVPGTLAWADSTLRFTPDGRLAPNTRYALSLAGARDLAGNRLDGDSSFSFVTRAGAAILALSPSRGVSGISGKVIEIKFSMPMATERTAAAFVLRDQSTGRAVPGTVSWDPTGTTLRFTANSNFTRGHRFKAELGANAVDADGNPVAVDWTFATAGVSYRTVNSTPAPPPPAGTDQMQIYALNQVNSARAAYGFAPVALDAAISAVAYAHSYDELVNGYFAHDSLDGTKFYQRLTAAGIQWSWSGENGCWRSGSTLLASLDWCHAGFMGEPYPGYPNHIANILNPKAHRVGIGIATSGSKVVVTWDFTD
jgi:uncharacterized protein YkwD